MLRKINVLKDVASKLGRKKASELIEIVEDNKPFIAELKITRAGIVPKKEEIMLKENQKIIIEYIED
ncbi:MAG: hypothetical protein ACRC92_12605 [Peptostreptococcaceae bacterium]